jgi:hypothetical protein
MTCGTWRRGVSAPREAPCQRATRNRESSAPRIPLSPSTVNARVGRARLVPGAAPTAPCAGTLRRFVGHRRSPVQLFNAGEPRWMGMKSTVPAGAMIVPPAMLAVASSYTSPNRRERRSYVMRYSRGHDRPTLRTRPYGRSISRRRDPCGRPPGPLQPASSP